MSSSGLHKPLRAMPLTLGCFKSRSNHALMTTIAHRDYSTLFWHAILYNENWVWQQLPNPPNTNETWTNCRVMTIKRLRDVLQTDKTPETLRVTGFLSLNISDVVNDSSFAKEDTKEKMWDTLVLQIMIIFHYEFTWQLFSSNRISILSIKCQNIVKKCVLRFSGDQRDNTKWLVLTKQQSKT